jgi:hypothetical protein
MVKGGEASGQGERLAVACCRGCAKADALRERNQYRGG